METFTQQHASLPRSGIKVLRVFQPDPASCIVRWAIAWGRRNEEPTTVEGTTQYLLNKEGQISSQTDMWEVTAEGGTESRPGESGSSLRLYRGSLSVGLARQPPHAARNPLPAFRLAVWEALKTNPDYGGQLVREEMDMFTMQFLYSCVGLGASVMFLLVRVLYVASQN
mmetsp:Transcript_23712/g.65793  ORF Transcript_23712/g.65793 Transcript_23712/m.65793 type:complete len:169 (+) Transcript_23712:808-1314(+)